MDITIGIQGHAAAQETIKLNCPTWASRNADFVGLEGDDSIVPCWPKYFSNVLTVPVREGKSLDYGLRPRLFADSMCELIKASNTEWVMWTEADSIMLGEPHGMEHNAMNACIVGYCPPEWNCGSGPFLHPPIIMDRGTAQSWAIAAAYADIEQSNGTPDVFGAQIAAFAGIPVKHLQGTWSTNGNDLRVNNLLHEARQAFRSGFWHIHAVKRMDQLAFILGVTNQVPEDTIYQ